MTCFSPTVAPSPLQEVHKSIPHSVLPFLSHCKPVLGDGGDFCVLSELCWHPLIPESPLKRWCETWAASTHSNPCCYLKHFGVFCYGFIRQKWKETFQWRGKKIIIIKLLSLDFRAFSNKGLCAKFCVGCACACVCVVVSKLLSYFKVTLFHSGLCKDFFLFDCADGWYREGQR